MNIDRILLIIIIIYLIISHSKMKKNIENFAVSDDIKATLKEIYNTDMQAVRDLDKLAKDIQNGGYSIDGKLTTKTLTVSGAFNLLPRGTIVAFNSTTAPDGWTLCDGSNGSPDLRGKFIRMWNDNTGGFNSDGYKSYSTSNASTYHSAWSGKSRNDQEGYILKHSFGSYAGSDLHHQHVNEMANHTHDGSGKTSDSGNHSHGMGGDICSNMPGCGYHGITKRDRSGQKTDGDGNHNHTFSFTTSATGVGWGASKQPPYYVLSWIMKL